MPRVSTCVIASNGTELDRDNPTPTWGAVSPSALEEGDLQFQGSAPYREGDTVYEGAARLQSHGRLPHGPLALTRATSTADDWVHEGHPIYHVDIDTDHTQDLKGYPINTTITYAIESSYDEVSWWPVNDEWTATEILDNPNEDLQRLAERMLDDQYTDLANADAHIDFNTSLPDLSPPLRVSIYIGAYADPDTNETPAARAQSTHYTVSIHEGADPDAQGEELGLSELSGVHLPGTFWDWLKHHDAYDNEGTELWVLVSDSEGPGPHSNHIAIAELHINNSQ